jgi:hypothetical protein
MRLPRLSFVEDRQLLVHSLGEPASAWSSVASPRANRNGRHGDERCGVAIGLRSGDLTRLALQASDGRSLFSLAFIVNTSLAIVRLQFESVAKMPPRTSRIVYICSNEIIREGADDDR